MSRLFVSPSAHERVAQAADFLRSLDARSPALVVAATPSAAALLCAQALPKEGVRFGWHKRTLGLLASELATKELAASGVSMVAGLGAEALCMRVVHELSAQRDLGRYAEVGKRPGFVRALLGTLDELRLAGVSAEALTSRDEDLGRVFQAYVTALCEARLADRAEVLEAATRCTRAGEHALLGVPLLLLDVPLLTRQEAELVAALCARSPSVLATVVRGDERSEAHLRAALAESSVVRSEPESRNDLTVLQARLFEPLPHPPVHAEVSRGHVRLVSSPGESREAVEVVRSLLEAARAGTAFDRMAIALRAASSYRAVVEEALARGDVPAHFADGVERPHRQGRALLALLECARDGLSARAFAEYLSLSVLPTANCTEGDEPVRSPRRWERMIVDASVVRDRARWERRLTGLLCSLEHERNHLDEDDPRRASLARDLEALGALRELALPLLDALLALPEGGTWGHWLDALKGLARMALRDSEGIDELLGELAPLSPIGPVTLADVHRTLSRRLPSLTVRSQGTSAGKVLVGAIDDLLGRSFDLVFVLGLAEKVFPPRVSEDALLPDAVRRELSSDLLLTEERARRERLQLRVAVGAAREQLVLSFPRFDLTHGRPRVPSFYGLEVLHAMDGMLPAFDDLNRRAHPGAAARMGWPAPERAEQAIDDAEYDLAMLDVLLRAPAEARKGAASYLLRANAHLARALRFRARRWMLGKFSPADGFVASSDSVRALAMRHAPSQRAYSATALSALSACPYRFYLQAIVGISPRDEVVEVDELDARQRGVLFHAVQRAVLTELRSQRLLPLEVSGYDSARATLLRHFESLSAQAREEFAPAIEGVFADALNTVRRDLEEWLRAMLDERSYTPAYFELGFGVRAAMELDAASRTDTALLANGLRLKGVIDLVEQATAHDGQGAPALRATDHKTGEVPEQLGIVSGGRVLQPLLYALALESLFPGHPVRSGRLYFCTSRAGFVSYEVPLDARARAVAIDLARAMDAMISPGFLPAAPALGECERCAFQPICGPYEEQRVAEAKNKDFARLAPLHLLRGLP